MTNNLLRLITTILLYLLLPGHTSAGEALNLLSDKAYDQAFRKAYIALMRGVDGEASFVLGKIYAEGLGATKKNQTKAIEYLSQAADQSDNRNAILYLAKQLSSGKFLKRNVAKALAYYEKAESKGWGNFSKEKLALLGRGQLGPKVCLSLSKVMGSKSSASDLRRYGQCLVDGIGVKKNIDQAKTYLERALSQKSSAAGIVLLEKIYLNDFRDFKYRETFLVFDQITQNKPSENEVKKIAELLEGALNKLFTTGGLESANTIFYEIATHDLAKAARAFTDPKTLDITTLNIQLADCRHAFENRVVGQLGISVIRLVRMWRTQRKDPKP